MDQAAGARGRGLGALLFGLVTVTAAVLAHWSGSGMTASPVVVVAGLAVASAVGWWLVPRRRARTVVLASVGLQVALHAGFAGSMALGGMRAMSLILCQTGHVGGVRVDAPAGFLAPQHGALAMLVGHQGMVMLAAHLIAGAVSGTWLYAVDRLARGLLAVLHALARAALPALPPVALTRPRHRAWTPAPRDAWAPDRLRDWVAAGCGRRGPPALEPC